MKKSFLYAALAGAFLSLGSCQDYIQEENLGNVLIDEYYQTQDGYLSLINSAYSTLRDVYGNEPWVFCAGTDMYVEGRSDQPPGISEYLTLTASNGEVTTFYTNVYQAIQTCNIAIHTNGQTAATDNLPVLLGEMKFLRAYYYFLLVQQFGGVPLVTDVYAYAENGTSFTRNSAEEVYTFILNEMNEAMNLVPESQAFGKVNKRVIRHYLAKVHLTRGYETFAAADDFTKAAQYADEAIAGQALTLSFRDLFFPGNEVNEEVLFSVQYDIASIQDPLDDGNMQNYYFGPYLGGEGQQNGYPYRSYMLVPTMYTFDLFTENDSRFDNSFMVYFYDRYYDYYDRNESLGDLNIRYYYVPKWELDDTTAWRAADLEHRANTELRPYSAAWEASNSTVLDAATPIVSKFDDPTARFSGSGSSTRDIYLARLAETYLIAAEAYFKTGNLGTAAERINEVRRRAAKPGTESEMMITAADVDIDFILDERGRELLGEYHRWNDLKRTGTLVERTELYNRDIRAIVNSGLDPFRGTNGALKILRPIPQNAIDLNDADVSQNPGY
ncbi:Starch-binding associating with outer membrane [Catalinimonas alkaloidigena]|uniref:Starch-binding associating with outer membrane n=1 Tax=Catalinimonas alkaloidigena TaxID=1075417 RepID=A0A1G9DHH4_9BACT|nr:RagB/SusD family nutrient uptake outer membrane protein [Catalinimonas alkaloidigena]SDK63343.1 Starch-binding associating with outer membrane [Catalinimonas alkaloidigena]